jgi:hypothetical protein
MADKKTIRLVATDSVRHNKQAYQAGREFEADEVSATRLIELGVAVKATSKEGREALKDAENNTDDDDAGTGDAGTGDAGATARTATKSSSKGASKGATK